MESDTTYLELRQSWLVTSIDGESSVTEGSITLTRDPQGGGWLLEVTSGDEDHPAGGGSGEGGDHVQKLLEDEYADLVRQALGGHLVGLVDHVGRQPPGRPPVGQARARAAAWTRTSSHASGLRPELEYSAR